MTEQEALEYAIGLFQGVGLLAASRSTYTNAQIRKHDEALGVLVTRLRAIATS